MSEHYGGKGGKSADVHGDLHGSAFIEFSVEGETFSHRFFRWVLMGTMRFAR